MICDLETGCVDEDQARAIELLRGASELEGHRPPRSLLRTARRAFARHAREVRASLEAARIAGDALHPNLPQCRIAAWLSRACRSRKVRLSRGDRAAVDRLLDRLARRFTAAAERALAEVFDDLPDRPDPTWLAGLEERIESMESEEVTKVDLREIATALLLPAD
ncbi:MAG: hypothetical protein GWN32_00725 [Gemmatimonadetes bacterium]|nr:hypothetical protein [Gemmatimonadota bacterium]